MIIFENYDHLYGPSGSGTLGATPGKRLRSHQKAGLEEGANVYLVFSCMKRGRGTAEHGLIPPRDADKSGF